MHELGVLRELGTAVLGAAGALVLARAVRVPPLLGYLVAGLLLGPAVGVLAVTESLELLAHLGVALLLFLVGLELSVERIREVGRSSVLTAAGQIALTLAAGAGLALGLGFSLPEALLLGLAVTFSSTVVVVKLLDESGELGTRHGRIAVGVLLVQDVAVALALTVVAGLAGTEGTGSVGGQLALSLVGLLVLVAGAAAAARWGLGAALSWLSSTPEAELVAALTWCLGLMFVAESAGLSVELGAFVAGVAVAQLPAAHDLRRRVQPLADFLLAVFFVTLGAAVDLPAAVRHADAVLALSALALVGKPVVVGGLLGRLGEADRTGLRAGLALGQISEFAFVLTAGAVAAGLVGDDVFSVVGGVGMVTIGVSAAVVPLAGRLEELLRGRRILRLFGRPGGAGDEPSPRRGHAVVVGMNAVGRELVRALAERGRSVVAVDTDPGKLAGLPAEAVVGDVNLRRVLEEVEAGGAGVVVSALRIEDTNRLLVHRCRELGVPVAVHALDRTQGDELLEAGADFVVVSEEEGARQIAARLEEIADGRSR